MVNVNATTFRKTMFSYFDDVIKYNEPLSIATKNGGVVILSEDEYRGIAETLYLQSIKGLKEDILEAANEPSDECISMGNRTLEEFIKDEL